MTPQEYNAKQEAKRALVRATVYQAVQERKNPWMLVLAKHQIWDRQVVSDALFHWQYLGVIRHTISGYIVVKPCPT